MYATSVSPVSYQPVHGTKEAAMTDPGAASRKHIFAACLHKKGRSKMPLPLSQIFCLYYSLACTVEQQQSEYECKQSYCLYDTDNDEVVSSTFSCCSKSIRCSSCAPALEES